MGLILDTDDPILGLEKRRESFNICDLQRKYPNDIDQPGIKDEDKYRQVLTVKSEHIFAYADGEIEISKDFLRRLVKFFDKPERRRMLEEELPETSPMRWFPKKWGE
jgi:hypothetical protein